MFFFERYIDSNLWFCSRQSCWFPPKCNWWIWSYVHQPQVHSQTDETDDFVGVHLLCLTSFPKYSPAAFLCKLPKTNSIFAEHRPKMPFQAVFAKGSSSFQGLAVSFRVSWFMIQLQPNTIGSTLSKESSPALDVAACWMLGAIWCDVVVAYLEDHTLSKWLVIGGVMSQL